MTRFRRSAHGKSRFFEAGIVRGPGNNRTERRAAHSNVIVRLERPNVRNGSIAALRTAHKSTSDSVRRVACSPDWSPLRRALFHERLYPLLRRLVDHVARHRLPGQLIGRFDPRFELPVEQVFTHCKCWAGFRQDRNDQLFNFGVELIDRNNAINGPPRAAVSASMSRRSYPFQTLLLTDVAPSAQLRRRANNPTFDHARELRIGRCSQSPTRPVGIRPPSRCRAARDHCACRL